MASHLFSAVGAWPVRLVVPSDVVARDWSEQNLFAWLWVALRMNDPSLDDGEESHSIEDLLRALEKHRVECEQAGRLAERMGVEEAHMLGLQEFSNIWDQKQQDFDARANQLQKVLATRHKQEHQAHLEKLRREVEPRTPRWSRDLLNLRKIQETLAKMRKYAEAEKTKVQADKLEAREHNQWKEKREARIAVMEEQFLHKQQLEMGGLLKRLKASREELRRSRKAEMDSAVGAEGSQTSGAEARPEAAEAAAAKNETGSSLKPNARRVHILPVFPSSCDQSQRLEILSPLLRSMRNSQTPVKTGLFLRPAGYEFVVVKCEPDDALLAMNTDYFIEGSPLKRFEKVQFICLWDFERTRTDQDATALFQEYINPYFKRLNSNEVTSIVSVNEQLQINGMEFQVMAAEPVPPEIGIVDLSTVVFVDWDNTPEFSKIHFVPFQDTLPAAYEYDIFNDYLKPYLTRNKQQSFAINDQFTFQGVQFKVVCCEPRGERGRIGKNTTIYCEGVLHPSLRNLLPPEMLEQLQSLPPGLQMMLLNTEALAGGYEERLMEAEQNENALEKVCSQVH
ncbi:hypothetical protein AK812_SmicGene30713 [Symbiodinium microadriaticum]|uniref:Uncharacterized protein n=1 Tax=Symbiodinium microadriaticum TaxID=2951 RepID=A0A1Q9CYR1_SYMMI|nr:hypothetical protein AK812_SmicGene30713 [Symbiodinium microadriaticum]